MNLLLNSVVEPVVEPVVKSVVEPVVEPMVEHVVEPVVKLPKVVKQKFEEIEEIDLNIDNINESITLKNPKRYISGNISSCS